MLVWLSKLEFLWPKQNQVPHFQLLKKAHDPKRIPISHQCFIRADGSSDPLIWWCFVLVSPCFSDRLMAVPKLGTPKSIKIRWLIIICRLHRINLGVSSGIWHSPKPPKHPWLHRSCVLGGPTLAGCRMDRTRLKRREAARGHVIWTYLDPEENM